MTTPADKPKPVLKRPSLDWKTWASEEWMALQRRLRRSISRENLLAAAKTSAWLVPLTLLIWIYAEREQVAKSNGDVPIPIEVRSNNPNVYVELRLPGRESAVTAQLSGPRGRLEEVSQRIAREARVMLTVPEALTPGQVHELDTAQQLATNPLFARSGVTLSDCKPLRLPVYVDEYTERDVEIQVPPNITNLVGAPIFEPRKVHVRAPRNAIEKASPLMVYAELAATGQLDKPGPHSDIVVQVRSPTLSGDYVSYTPSTVKATFEVRQADVTYTIPSMAIFVIGPPNLLAKYKVDCPSTLANMTVIGPPDKVELLQKEGFPKPKAVLEVSRDDLPPNVVHTARSLHFYKDDLPEGVRFDEDSMQRAKVDFKLVDQAPE